MLISMIDELLRLTDSGFPFVTLGRGLLILIFCLPNMEHAFVACGLPFNLGWASPDAMLSLMYIDNGVPTKLSANIPVSIKVGSVIGSHELSDCIVPFSFNFCKLSKLSTTFGR